MIILKASNIEWDVEEKIEGLPFLPSEVEIPDEIFKGIDMTDKDEVSECVSDYLSEKFGFCHCGFELKMDKDIEK